MPTIQSVVLMIIIPLVTVLYFILRGIANIFLACNFVLIDAQVITMCELEAKT